MNRIHQGKVTNVETANPDQHAPPDQRWLPFDPDPNRPKPNGHPLAGSTTNSSKTR